MALERATIVQTALTLLDEVGMDGVSTRRLATELGVKGPSLYWHFRSMRELYDHMAEVMLAEALPSADPKAFQGDWRTWLATGARAIRRAALSRRDGARVLLGARPTGASPLISFPAMVARLQSEGFSPSKAVAAIQSLGRFAMGWALDEQSALTPATPEESEAAFEFGLNAMLTGLEAYLQEKSQAARQVR